MTKIRIAKKKLKNGEALYFNSYNSSPSFVKFLAWAVKNARRYNGSVSKGGDYNRLIENKNHLDPMLRPVDMGRTWPIQELIRKKLMEKTSLTSSNESLN